MPRIIVTAQVEDGVEWERKFRTHAELFKRNHLQNIHYTVTDNNEIVTYSQIDDLDAYMEFMRSEAVANAMEEDGVKRETVKIYVLDKELAV